MILQSTTLSLFMNHDVCTGTGTDNTSDKTLNYHHLLSIFQHLNKDTAQCDDLVEDVTDITHKDMIGTNETSLSLPLPWMSNGVPISSILPPATTSLVFPRAQPRRQLSNLESTSATKDATKDLAQSPAQSTESRDGLSQQKIQFQKLWGYLFFRDSLRLRASPSFSAFTTTNHFHCPETYPTTPSSSIFSFFCHSQQIQRAPQCPLNA